MPRFPKLLLIAGLAAFALTFCGGQARAEKRVALVIGNSAYEKFARLPNPVNDAKLVADTLIDLNFTLIGGGAQRDLDKAGFDKAVRAFGLALESADIGLFYFAGHGVEVKGTNYLIPVDANTQREADVDFQLISLDLILRQIGSAKTKLNFVMLDACRNNPLAGARSAGGGLAVAKASTGTLISYATQPGNVALDGEDGHSPYTKALARTMRKPGLPQFEFLNEVGLLVKILTNDAQEPWQSSSPIGIKFYFAGQESQTAVLDTVAPAAANATAPSAPAKTVVVVPPPKSGDPKTCSSAGGDYIVKNVKFSDPVGGLVVRSAPRASADGLGVIPAEATGLAVSNCQGGWCEVRYNCVSGWSSSSFLDQRSRNLYRVAGVSPSDPDGLNMRRSPGYNSSKTGAIPYNASDVVMHACEAVPHDQTWCLATYGNKSGWVAQRFLSR